jgi:hypothetical protein
MLPLENFRHARTDKSNPYRIECMKRPCTCLGRRIPPITVHMYTLEKTYEPLKDVVNSALTYLPIDENLFSSLWFTRSYDKVRIGYRDNL